MKEMVYVWDAGGGDDHTSSRGHIGFKRRLSNKNSTSRTLKKGFVIWFYTFLFDTQHFST